MAEKKNVYVSLHEAFVREGIQYTDRRTGEQRSFNVVRLPPDTVIDGRDVGGYEFSPLYVNPSRFRGEHWRDVPLLADREVRLSRSVLDAEGRPILGRALGGEEALRGGERTRRKGPGRAGRGGEGSLREHGAGRRAPFRP